MSEEHWLTLILAVLGPLLAGLIAGAGWWIKNAARVRHAQETARKEDKLADLQKIEELQCRIETMLHERIADEANKRHEADTSVKLLTEMTALLKTALSLKGPP